MAVAEGAMSEEEAEMKKKELAAKRAAECFTSISQRIAAKQLEATDGRWKPAPWFPAISSGAAAPSAYGPGAVHPVRRTRGSVDPG